MRRGGRDARRIQGEVAKRADAGRDDPALFAVAEARPTAPRVRSTSFRPGDQRTMMLIEVLEAPP
jgi:hypothetical protein